jgi:glycerol-3-phosphate acyltransferase PlsY
VGWSVFLAVLSLGLLLMPLGADAQPGQRVYRVGYLGAGEMGPPRLWREPPRPGPWRGLEGAHLFEALRAGLREHGHVEGRNLALEFRWAEGKFERLPGLAVELVGLPVDVLVVGTDRAALVAKAATRTTPIVFIGSDDPVGRGLVASLARPGRPLGNSAHNLLAMAVFATEVAVVLASYACGCFLGAYYLFRWRTGRDIRDYGSHNPGAMNAGRLLGTQAFVIVLALDAAKAAIAVGAARYFCESTGCVVAAIVGVVAGHIWPLQLGFRGGKGVAASLGVALVYAPLTLALGVGVFLVLRTALRSFTLAGLTSLALAPVIEWGIGHDAVRVLALGLIVALVLPRHRSDIVDEVTSRSMR